MKEREFDTKIVCLTDAMYRLARSLLSDESEARDAVQDILEKMWRDRAGISGLTNLKGFVLVSVRNNCLDRLRKRKVRRSTGLDCGRELPARSEQNYEDQDLVWIAKKAMQQLPEKQRSAMHLRDIEGLEIEEIAALMGADEVTVRSNLSRARKKIRDEINKVLEYGAKGKI